MSACHVQCETDEEKLDWMMSSPQSIRVNDQIRPGRIVCIVPDPEIVGRWNLVAEYESLDLAVAFAAGFCVHRNSQTDRVTTRSR